ncbi:MAG: 5-methyltetrahydropteroyltriglutamate--homocysteine methyltransferase [Archaeoglobaceae archaeon]
MLFDDVGSFPLPKGISREWAEKNYASKEYEEMVQRAFLMKARVVEVPNYPQFRDMIRMFAEPIKNPEFQEDAYLISRKHAIIPELEYVEKLKAERVRVCITGPFELYYREFGGVIYEDVLLNLAESVRRFAENAAKYENVVCVSIDEPSLGIAPDLQPGVELIERAFDYSLSCDLQVHLHDPLFYDKFSETGVEIIGVEAAREPRNLEAIDAELLRSAEKKLRIGIARSDIDGIISEFNAMHNVNAWQSDELIEMAIEEIEPEEKIYGRLVRAFERFGELLAYVGPDCGLFSFPSQDSALRLLSNVRKAVERFRRWTT